MDPVSLIVAALAAGALAGAKDAMTSTVTDAYAGLKTLVLRRLGGEPAGERALQRLEQNPEAGQADLRAELERIGAGDDEQLVAAARELSETLDASDRKADRYTVDARGAQGVQIGDHGTQNNDFNVPPSPTQDDARA